MIEGDDTIGRGPAAAAPTRGSGFGLFLAFAVVVGAYLASLVATRPIAALGIDAPTEAFSAARGEAVLRDLLSEGVPHPVGSEANRVVRDRIVAQLRGIGLAPTVERHFVVAPNENVSAWVENVVARIPGAEPGPAIVLAAHYDSVPAGPGASDDGIGVATVIESARAIRAGSALRRDVLLLITDGEEAGLLGARGHVKAHGVDDIAAVVNIEARGTSGPSLMFETGPGTAATVPAWTGGARRVLSSSLFASVYRRMPNDTDLTVFRRLDVPGLNFACVGRVQHYHTPLDSVANVDLRTLQHHGDNALAAVRGLAAAELASVPAVDAREVSWFDVLGLATVRWPIAWTLPLALAAFLSVMLGIAARVRRGELRGAVITWGLTAALATLAATTGLVAGLGWAFHATSAVPGAFVASSSGPLAAAAGAGLLVVGAVGVLSARRAGALGLWSGAWFLIGGGGVAVALLLPEAAWLLLVPAFAAGATGALLAFRPRAPAGMPGTSDPGVHAATIVPLAVGCVLWFPFVPLVTDALGLGWLAVPAIPYVLASVVLLPAVAAGGGRRWMIAAAGLVLTASGVVATFVAAPWTPELPRRMNVAWSRDAADHHAHWIVRLDGPMPPAMLAAHAFEDETARIVPYENVRGWAAEAPFVDLPGPALDDLQIRAVAQSRRVRFRLTSRRGAPVTTLAIDPKARIRRVTIGGTVVPPESIRVGTDGPFVIHCLTTPPEGVEIDIDIADERPLDLYVSDQSSGLPRGADEILRSRPSDAAPHQDGDVTIVHRKLRL
ncbi:MAG: M28 family peptidase [Planctomycetes bacterium]|nr:M28 family peptidase [Planctomycetota bacterium]